MLKLASENDLAEILRFCDSDLLGIRIGCYCLAYGFERDFLKVWINETDGIINTAIAKFYDSVTVKSSSTDTSEITEFLNMIGYTSLDADADFCRRTLLDVCSTKKAYIFRGISTENTAEEIGEENYKSLYSLVSENIPGSFVNSKEAYLSFLSDFTFRKRRGFARSKGIVSDGKLVSCVITSAETDKCALLSAVASDKSVRGKGYGKKTVLSAVNELLNENKDVYVIALNESAQSFYEHIGFEYYTDICHIERKNDV